MDETLNNVSWNIKNEWSCASSLLVLFRVLYRDSFAIYRCASAGGWFEI